MSSIPLVDPNEEMGKLFDVPRVGIVTDLTDPTVIKLAFGGSIELDRGNAQQIEFYNSLMAGHASDLVIGVHVKGAKMAHRRDSEGDVDAVVQTKSLVVTDVYFDAQGDDA
jgi:hypothetical protein